MQEMEPWDGHARHPTFQITCAMSRAVFTVSTTRPMSPGGGGFSSSSSKGMNMPEGVLRSPPPLLLPSSKLPLSFCSDNADEVFDRDGGASDSSIRGRLGDGFVGVGVLGRLDSNARVGCQGSSSSSSESASASRKFVDGLEGRRVSCDGEGERRLERQKPREWVASCDCSSVTSGESVRFFRVVEGRGAMILLSPVKLAFEF